MRGAAERLCKVFGAALAIAGVFVLTVVGAMYGYSNTTVWLAGLGLLIAGIAIAKSMALIQFLHDLTRG